MSAPLYVPLHVGVRCLEERSQVPWGSLKDAHTGRSIRAPWMVAPAPRTALEDWLADIGDSDDEVRGEAVEGFVDCIYHQGTLYEATAYAVPFLCALAAAPLPNSESELLSSLVLIGEATSYTSNVILAAQVLSAFAASASHIEAIALRPGATIVRRFLSALGGVRAHLALTGGAGAKGRGE